MRSEQFTKSAKFYDLLYKDKDYEGEAKYIHELIKNNFHSNGLSLKILDLACGTGKHLIELGKLGYSHLFGSDITSEMIKLAKKNSKDKNQNIKYYNYSFQEADQITKKFDIIISMFSAINYVTTYEEQVQSLKNIHNLLDNGGIFIFDYWNGNAVVKDYSPVRVLKKKNKKAQLIRFSETSIDLIAQRAEVKFSCHYMEDGIISEFEELHHLHYYFFSEMSNLLKSSGFKIIHQCPFMEISKEIGAYDWNISVVAKKE